MTQAIPIAINSKLLLRDSSSTTALPPTATQPSPSQSTRMLSKLIPRRVEDVTNSPFGGPTFSDKRARHLYAAINGQRTVEELGASTHIDHKEALQVLQTLVDQQRIELYSSEGRLVDISTLLNNY